MNPYELLNPNGKPCGVFCCGKCNIVMPEDLAEKCCKPCSVCGKETENRFSAECHECFYSQLAERDREKLDAAEEIEWDGESMILYECVRGSQDGWYGTPEDAVEAVYWGLKDDPELEPSQFAFASIKRVKGLDLENAFQDMIEDTHEDAEIDDDAAVAELQKAVDVFNEKCSITYFDPDYSRKVRIPLERLTENA